MPSGVPLFYDKPLIPSPQDPMPKKASWIDPGRHHPIVGAYRGRFADEAVVDGPWSETREERYRYPSPHRYIYAARGERGVTQEVISVGPAPQKEDRNVIFVPFKFWRYPLLYIFP